MQQETAALETVIAAFRTRVPRPPLHPRSVWDESLSRTIGGLPAGDLTKSGLFVWNDDLERAHSLAQQIELPEGALWHAILHRRDGDFSNAAYWYRRAGGHPVFEDIRRTVPDWDPFSFIELCCAGETEELLEIQVLEIEALLSYIRNHGL